LRVLTRDALNWWAARLDAHGVEHEGVIERNGRASLPFVDAEGQQLILVAEDGAQGVPGGTPWSKSSVPEEFAIRGLSHVAITVNRLAPTASILTGVIGFRQTGG